MIREYRSGDAVKKKMHRRLLKIYIISLRVHCPYDKFYLQSRPSGTSCQITSCQITLCEISDVLKKKVENFPEQNNCHSHAISPMLRK